MVAWTVNWVLSCQNEVFIGYYYGNMWVISFF